jgi:subtilisin family serine protease
VHKTNPHTYGISYFSSRGPDVVAPGEKILSARHDWKNKPTPTVRDLYVEMSGTSMAAPHVAGCWRRSCRCGGSSSATRSG